MWIRIVTALLLAPVVILLTLSLPTHWLSVMLLAVALLGLYEWNRLTINAPALFAITAIGLATATWWLVYQAQLLFLICLFSALFWLYQTYRLSRFRLATIPHPPAQPKCRSVLHFLLGAFCLLGVWAALVLLHQQTEQGGMATVALFVMVWAADCFAYFTGKTVGKNKLAPALSPNKTVEGVVGGLFGVAVIAALFGLYLFGFSVNRLSVWMVAALSIAVFSVVGDLYESRLKRLAGVKDSGHLLPGHGGILDRIDGLIAATPVFVTLIIILQPEQWPQ